MAPTQEVTVAGTDRVHVEHIYPQNPKADDRWDKHAAYVTRLGNLTLARPAAKRQIKNAMFPVKKAEADQISRLEITRQLVKYEDWSPERVEERQLDLLNLAKSMWPQELIEDAPPANP